MPPLEVLGPSPAPTSSRENRSQRHGQSHDPVNVGATERTASILAGVGLAALGLTRGSLSGLLAAGLGGALIYRGATGECGLYAKLGIDTSGSSADPSDYYDKGVHVEHAFTVRKMPAELYNFWRNFENLPRFMKQLESVRVLDDRRSHWVVKAPRLAGGQVEWDAEIINDEPNALIAWRSLPGADVHNTGSVRFVPAPMDFGTEVRVTIEYIPPAGTVGRWTAKLLGEAPEAQIKEDLRNFKRIMETGELATIQGQPRGTCKGGGTRQDGW